APLRSWIRRRSQLAIALLVARAAAAGAIPTVSHVPTPRFEVKFSAAAHAAPITGRLVLFFAKAAQPEPRLLLSPRGPALLAVDLDQVKPGQTVVVDNSALGYPGTLADLPAGDYFVQAVINVYEEVHRADGKTLWLHMNDGTIEIFSAAAGNV